MSNAKDRVVAKYVNTKITLFFLKYIYFLNIIFFYQIFLFHIYIPYYFVCVCCVNEIVCVFLTLFNKKHNVR